MKTTVHNAIRRMMRKVAAISADLEKMASEQHAQIATDILKDCSRAADVLGHKLESLIEE